MNIKQEKRCIVHIPNHIEKSGKSGSNIRPIKMKQAFEENGYLVEYISGYGTERKVQINKIKRNIRNGIKYDFLYSESSTMPTLLTEKNHLPRYPFLDFSFFKFCKKNGIKIGLFYRDIQWKFSVYRDNVSWYKKCFSIPMYRYDLRQYKKLLNVFYLPTDEMRAYLKEYPELLNRSAILMPGCAEYGVDAVQAISDLTAKKLEILYVGGIDRIYDLTVFFQAMQQMPDQVHAYVCCREKEWENAKSKYLPYMSEKISIIHESGQGLEPYYKKADICCAFAGEGDYMRMAMPIKVFEYLGHYIPIIATKDTAAGKFIEKENLGWSIEYNQEALKQCLHNILQNPALLQEKRESEISAYEANTWKARAKQVILDLK